METIKRYLSKQWCRLLIGANLFIIVYLILNIGGDLITGLINALFIIGIFYVLIGLKNYIYNIGLFKSFRYLAYKIKIGAYGRTKREVHSLDFGEFTTVITSDANQKYSKYHYIFGFGYLITSYVLVLLVY